MAFDLKSLVLDPLRGGRHEDLEVPEWDGARVIVRAPSAGDYATWRMALREAASVVDTDTEDAARDKILQADMSIASARLLVRVLYQRIGKGDKAVVARVLADADAPALAASWTPVHERLLEAAFKLSGVPDEATAKNSSAESPTSAS